MNILYPVNERSVSKKYKTTGSPINGLLLKPMVWEGEPLPAVALKLKEIGVSSLVYDPCGNVPEKGDFLSVMQNNVRNIKAEL